MRRKSSSFFIFRRKNDKMIINIPRPSVASVRNVFCREPLKYSHSILCPIKFYVQTLRIKLWILQNQFSCYTWLKCKWITWTHDDIIVLTFGWLDPISIVCTLLLFHKRRFCQNSGFIEFMKILFSEAMIWFPSFKTLYPVQNVI